MTSTGDRPSILLTRRWPEAVETFLHKHFVVTTRPTDQPMSREELATALHNHDALCPTVTDQIDADLLATAGPRVRIIGNFGAGYQNIDAAACRNLGICVTNTPDVLTEATANLTLMLMLMVTRRAGEGERRLRAGRWPGWSPTDMMGGELAGQLLGIVGFGRIGQAVALKASLAFGMDIAWYGHPPRGPIDPRINARRIDNLDELVARADILSLHAPGGAGTHHLIDRRRLATMKASAVIINTARGTLIDEAALGEALTARRIAAAGLDVYENEPAIAPSLLALDHVVMLPHLGSATIETRTAMGMRVARNLTAFFSGSPPPDRVA